MRTLPYLLSFVFLTVILIGAVHLRKDDPAVRHRGWSTYAGTPDAMRYSSLTQVDTSNVHRLEVAWTHSSGDADPKGRTQNQCNPIVVDGVMYATSPTLKLLALEASTGRLLWSFDPRSADSTTAKDMHGFLAVSRGVMFWQDEKGSDRRVFYSVGRRTFAIDVRSGRPIPSFGKGGYILLTEGLDREMPANAYVMGTTPGVVWKDLLIMGSKVDESPQAAPGHIRAFDARTGKRRWIFHTIPHPGEVGYDSWPDKEAWKRFGGANSWAGLSLDTEKGIVYVPTGSIGGDFYGGDRKGSNLFANSLLALDASTGKYLWHFQVLHHDIWDRDLAATPNLVNLRKGGKTVPAVAQITKHGYVFLFDRYTGKPLFPIEERPVPQDALPGEHPWPTQPIPVLPEPFARQSFSASDLNEMDPASHAEAKAVFDKVKGTHMFSPPSKEGSWIFPGFDGGGEWGGAAVDPARGILYVNSTELPWHLTMVDRPGRGKPEASAAPRAGAALYEQHCQSCHGADLKGNGPSFPSLVGIGKRLDEKRIASIVTNGQNMMPGFAYLEEGQISDIVGFLLEKDRRAASKAPSKGNAQAQTKNGPLEEPYAMTGYNRFITKDGYPGIKPPWGTLNAVDLNSGKLLWKVPLGHFDALTGKVKGPTGTQVYGGPVVTAGGLVFVASTQDERIRAFDKRTGRELWSAKLPAAGYATPAVYEQDGRQFIVIACGGGKLGSPSGDSYVAFALPKGI